MFTNTVPVDAYRGAGRPEATFVVERVVETAAREMGIDPAELRRRNFVPSDAFPYQTPVALQYDSGNYAGTIDLAMQAIDYAGFKARQSAVLRTSCAHTTHTRTDWSSGQLVTAPACAVRRPGLTR